MVLIGAAVAVADVEEVVTVEEATMRVERIEGVALGATVVLAAVDAADPTPTPAEADRVQSPNVKLLSSIEVTCTGLLFELAVVVKMFPLVSANPIPTMYPPVNAVSPNSVVLLYAPGVGNSPVLEAKYRSV